MCSDFKFPPSTISNCSCLDKLVCASSSQHPILERKCVFLLWTKERCTVKTHLLCAPLSVTWPLCSVNLPEQSQTSLFQHCRLLILNRSICQSFRRWINTLMRLCVHDYVRGSCPQQRPAFWCTRCVHDHCLYWQYWLSEINLKVKYGEWDMARGQLSCVDNAVVETWNYETRKKWTITHLDSKTLKKKKKFSDCLYTVS